MGAAWDVTPDVERYDEAVDWFLKRTVVKASDARQMDDRLKAQSFWVGGGLKLTQVQRVFDKIEHAITKGTPFEEFKKAVATELRNPHHVETVFRNATQRAYNAGRWHQMHEPSVLRFRPYGLVDAILDNRTTPYCKDVNGTLLALDDPWWDTHWFPAHHRCRTSVRNLRRSEAEKRGLKPPPPDQSPAPGFGLSPANDAWKPDPKKHDSALYQQLELKFPKASKARKRQTPATPEGKKPKLDPSKYLGDFTPRYGQDLAKPLAHGKAALEHGLDLPVSAIRAELAKLPSYAGVRRLLEALEDTDAGRSVREQAGETDPLKKLAAALAGHLNTLDARKGPIRHAQLAKLPGGTDALKFFGAMTSKAIKNPDQAWTFMAIPGKGGVTRPGQKLVIYGTGEAGILEHELGHVLEDLNPKMFERAREFLLVRTKDDALLYDPGTSETRDFHYWPDDFYAKYTGCKYGPRHALHGTEITSTALELLVAEISSLGTLEELATIDLEHLLFLLGQLAGK